MNILIVNYEYPPLGGGGGVATKELAEELAKQHQVHVLTSAFTNLPRTEVLNGVHVHRAPVFGRRLLPTATISSMISFAVTAIWSGMRLCQRQKFDVINAQFVLPSGLPAVILAKVFRLPLVISLIGGDLYDPSKGISPHRHAVLRALIRTICRQAHGITAISNDTKKRAQEFHQVIEPITVTPIGLVPKNYPPIDRNTLRLPEGFLAVSIGRLIPRKGYEILLNAWKQLPEGKLVIIGDGPLRRELEKQVKELDLTDRVWLLGAVTEERKHQTLQAADAYVSAASHEGFGIVFLEAMAAGLPIVAPNEGGQTDFLQPNRHALLVDSSQPETIAAAVSRLQQDEALRNRMGTENREHVRSFTIDKTTATFARVLENAIRSYEGRN